MDAALTFFHAPNTRSSGIRLLLEELGAPHTLQALNMMAGEQRGPAFLAVNPLGKVPAISHGGALVTEQVAITLYLADQFPAAGLAPSIGDPLRGPYLRWLVYYAAAFEPAVVDRAEKRAPSDPRMSPYGTFDGVMDALEAQAVPGPWLLGDRFTAADVLWGMALGWTMQFKLVPERPAFTALVARLRARPAFGRVVAADHALAAAQAEANRPGTPPG